MGFDNTVLFHIRYVDVFFFLREVTRAMIAFRRDELSSDQKFRLILSIVLSTVLFTLFFLASFPNPPLPLSLRYVDTYFRIRRVSADF